jgi:hypothetical protein
VLDLEARISGEKAWQSRKHREKGNLVYWKTKEPEARFPSKKCN